MFKNLIKHKLYGIKLLKQQKIIYIVKNKLDNSIKMLKNFYKGNNITEEQAFYAYFHSHPINITIHLIGFTRTISFLCVFLLRFLGNIAPLFLLIFMCRVYSS
jgi:hypothetical protein